MPPTALHLLSRRPTGCHPSSDLPLKSVIGWPQAGCAGPPQRRRPRAGPRQLLAVTRRHRARDPIALEPSLERDVAGIAFPLWRNGEAERAVGEFDLGDRPRAAAGSHELSDQGGRAGPFHLEPRWRRLCAALDDEIPSAQQRVGCGARLCESSRIPRGRKHQRGADCDASNHDSSSRPLLRYVGASYNMRIPATSKREYQGRPVAARQSYPRGFAPRTPRHALSRTASPARFRLRAKRYGETSPEPWRRRAVRVAHSLSLARVAGKVYRSHLGL